MLVIAPILLSVTRRQRPQTCTLFPYTTLFRSVNHRHVAEDWSHRAERAINGQLLDRKSTRLNSSHGYITYAVFCLKKKIDPPEPAPTKYTTPLATILADDNEYCPEV